uniref:Uncharacterized protein n=1 Tax=Anguilla anguilla TaxID=7936 RepID=A0A0E9UKY2_ANGAN
MLYYGVFPQTQNFSQLIHENTLKCTDVYNSIKIKDSQEC